MAALNIKALPALIALAVLAVVGFVGFRYWQGPVVPAYQLEAAPLVQRVVATGRVVSTSRTQIGSEVTGMIPAMIGTRIPANSHRSRKSRKSWLSKNNWVQM